MAKSTGQILEPLGNFLEESETFARYQLKKRSTFGGKINFVSENDPSSACSQFLSMSETPEGDELVNFIQNQWNLRLPKLVISIIEDESSKVDTYQRECIRDGITKAALTDDCWILTNGLNTGLCKDLGYSVRRIKNQQWVTESKGKKANLLECIGFNSWDNFEHCESMGKHFNGLEIENQEYSYLIRHRKRDASSKPHLNPGHSHFVFLGKPPDQSFSFRQQFELSLTKRRLDYLHNNRDAIPLVTVVLGGTLSDFKAIENYLLNGVPVVLCQGTGGASRVVLQVLKNFPNDPTVEGFMDDKSDVLKKLIKESVTLDVEPDEKFDPIQSISNIIKRKDLVFVYKSGKVEKSSELDSIILQAILQGDLSQNFFDPLEMCFVWDRPDTAATQVLVNEKTNINSRKNVKKIMLRAMMEDKVSFIKLLKDFGFVMKDFLIGQRLQFLYNYSAKTNEVLKWLLYKNSKHTESSNRKCSLRQIAKLIHRLTGFKDSDLSKVEGHNLTSRVNKVNFKTYDDPYGKLFIWAVLSNKRELSQFFWQYVKEPVSMAIVGSKLWQAQAQRLWPGEDVFKPEFTRNSEEMESEAVKVIGVCYRVNHELARALLEHPSSTWPRDKSIMATAISTNRMKFLATPCVQSCVDILWKSGVTAGYVKVAVCAIFPPLLFYLDIVSPEKHVSSRKNAGSKKTETDVRFDSNGGTEMHSMTNDGSFNALGDQMDHKLSMSKRNGIYRRIETGDPSHAGVRASSSADKVGFLEEKTRFEIPKSDVDKTPVENISIFAKIQLFYSSPLTKFTVHSMAYICYLVIFCWMVLKIDNDHPTNEFEVYIASVAACYFIDEIRQLLCESGTLRMKLKSYFGSEWNIIDVTYLPLIGVAFVLNRAGQFDAARIVYGVVALLMWVRVIRLYQAAVQLGPLWIMMRKMFKEMLIFITVLIVFLLAYGVCTVTLIFKPETLKQEGWASTLEFVILIPSLQMFGELFLDTLVEGREAHRLEGLSYKMSQMRREQMRELDKTFDTLTNVERYTPKVYPAMCLINDFYPTFFQVRTSYNNWETNVTWTWKGDNLTRDWETIPDPVSTTPFPDIFVQDYIQSSLSNWLLAAYLLVGNVLILNLLIAIFGNVYDIVQDNSTIEWKNEMLHLCKECTNKTVLPPPFSIFETVWSILKLVFKRSRSASEAYFDEEVEEKLRLFESYCLSIYQSEKRSRKTVEENISILTNHADQEMERIGDMINVVENLRKDLEPDDF